MKRSPRNNNKRGEVLSLTVLLLIALGSLVQGFFVGDAIFDVGDQFFDWSTNQTLSADFENSYVPQILRLPLSTNESASGDLYFPKQTEDLNIQVGLLIIEWSVLGNLNDGVNFTTAMASSDRRFFLNLGGTANGTQIVDPMNNPDCQNTTSLGYPGYTCSFDYVIPQSSGDGPFNVFPWTVTPRNHAVNLFFVTIEPLDRPSVLATASSIAQYYFEKSKLVIAIWIQILTYIYYIVVIGFALAVLFGIGWALRKLYLFISGTGKRNNG